MPTVHMIATGGPVIVVIESVALAACYIHANAARLMDGAYAVSLPRGIHRGDERGPDDG